MISRLEMVESACAELLKADKTLSYHQAEEPLRLHALGEASGRLIMIVTIMSRPRTILELGTGMGYSTLWLAQGATKVGSRIITIEKDEGKSLAAQGLLRRYALDEGISFSVEDAISYLEQQTISPDLVLLDLDKSDYLRALEALLPLNRKHPTVLLADNLLSHRSELSSFVARLDENENIDHLLIPVGKGIEIALLGS